ncbi:MAG: ACP S-malonyltransferase [Anaerolineales bacterium]
MPLTPERTAFVFPGQGSQAIGMGMALAEAAPEAARVFQLADEILGYPLSQVCWHGPEADLNSTQYTQPALLTHSIAVLEVFKARHPGFMPACTAGHSMGEYSALVAAGVLSFNDGLLLTRKRGEAMGYAGEIHPGGMSAVIGLDVTEVEAACEKASAQSVGTVAVANDNCPGQVVISGDENALALAHDLLDDAGARKVIRLAVSIGAHSPLMIPAQDLLNDAITATSFNDPLIPVVGNVSAKPLTSIQEIREDLNAQLTSRVRWTESIGWMVHSGVDTFIEMGSGTVLSGLLRRIDAQTRGISLDSPPTWDTI